MLGIPCTSATLAMLLDCSQGVVAVAAMAFCLASVVSAGPNVLLIVVDDL